IGNGLAEIKIAGQLDPIRAAGKLSIDDFRSRGNRNLTSLFQIIGFTKGEPVPIHTRCQFPAAKNTETRAASGIVRVRRSHALDTDFASYLIVAAFQPSRRPPGSGTACLAGGEME